MSRLVRPSYAPGEGSYPHLGMVYVVLTPDQARDLAHMYGPRDTAFKELMNDADVAEREWIEDYF